MIGMTKPMSYLIESHSSPRIAIWSMGLLGARRPRPRRYRQPGPRPVAPFAGPPSPPRAARGGEGGPARGATGRGPGCRYRLGRGLRAPRRPMDQIAILGLEWDSIKYDIGLVIPIIFLALICYFMWRTLRLMPRTKPQEITPRSKSSVTWED